MAAMRRGDFDAAWAISDSVIAARNPAARDDPAIPYHRRWVWNGAPIHGQNVLVRCYHGLGDTLQFVRFLPALRACAAAVTMEAQPELIPLLETCNAFGQIIPFRKEAPAPPSECDIEIMELAHALRLRPEAAPPPYLWLPFDNPMRGAVGLCWIAGEWDAERSLPSDLLSPLLTAGPPIVSLCPGKALGPSVPAECPHAVERTASLMGRLDLIITVDTMIAHLAGALGLPTWLLLKHEPDWRWTPGPRRYSRLSTSVWYPSLRIFRQPSPGDWQSVIIDVAARLTARSCPTPGHRRQAI